jgi:hypothetical protein
VIAEDRKAGNARHGQEIDRRAARGAAAGSVLANMSTTTRFCIVTRGDYLRARCMRNCQIGVLPVFSYGAPGTVKLADPRLGPAEPPRISLE